MHACLRAEAGWYNSGYIFPEGFTSRVSFRSSVVLDQLCVHECTVIGRGGTFWPAPTFKVTAMDRADEPLIAKSCTGCWSAVRLDPRCFIFNIYWGLCIGFRVKSGWPPYWLQPSALCADLMVFK